MLHKNVQNRNALYGRAAGSPTALAHDGFGEQPAYAFWHCKQDSGRLPDVAVDGLASASGLGRLKVFLLSYSLFVNVPAGLSRLDASDYLPPDAFESMLAAGTLIQHAADFVRLRAIAQTKGKLAWFWNCDALVFKDLRAFPVKPDAFNHVISSMARRPMTPGKSM